MEFVFARPEIHDAKGLGSRIGGRSCFLTFSFLNHEADQDTRPDPFPPTDGIPSGHPILRAGIRVWN